MGSSAPVPADGPPSGERYRLVLPTDLTLVGQAVETVTACCFANVDPCRRTRFRLATVVAEAVANAMLYGNHGDRTRQVSIDIEIFADRIVVAVADQGDGFDPEAVPAPEDQSLDATRGRGLFMIRRLADQVAFNPQGNTIWMTLPRR